MKRRVGLAGLFITSLLVDTPRKCAGTSWVVQCASVRTVRRRSCSPAALAAARHPLAISRNMMQRVHKQQAELDNAEARAKRDACYGGNVFLFRRTPKASCPALVKRIDKMKSNLAALERKRNQYAPSSERHGANEKPRFFHNWPEQDVAISMSALHSPVRQQRRGLFGALFGGGGSTVRGIQSEKTMIFRR